MLQPVIHYGLHFIAPLGLSFLFFRENLWKAYAVMLASMIVDADHLLASPVFDPGRCSIGYHPLHTLYAIGAYLLLLIFWKKKYSRMLMTGLLFHMATDMTDCLLMFQDCSACSEAFIKHLF